jgi:hypothetical protein
MSRSDRDLLRGLARHIRKHEMGCFDPDELEDERAEHLVSWLAENVDVLNIPDPAR